MDGGREGGNKTQKTNTMFTCQHPQSIHRGFLTGLALIVNMQQCLKLKAYITTVAHCETSDIELTMKAIIRFLTIILAEYVQVLPRNLILSSP